MVLICIYPLINYVEKLLKKDFIFLKHLWFTAILRGDYRDFPHTPVLAHA